LTKKLENFQNLVTAETTWCRLVPVETPSLSFACSTFLKLLELPLPVDLKTNVSSENVVG
jgi:hypothetical protein